MLQTKDAGKSWDILYQVVRGGHPHFQAIWYIDRKQGWAASALGLLQTNDGGKSWKQKEEGLFFDLLFVDERYGWVVGLNGIILRTEDGGKNWQHQESGIGATSLNGVHFINENEGWVVGSDGTVLHTKSGGQKWIPQRVPLNGNFYALQFLNSKAGWVLGRNLNGNSIFYTKDGGKHWEEQLFLKNYFISDLNFVNHREGWAVGGLFSNNGVHSVILNTTDGGRTWRKLEKTIGVALYGIGYAGKGTLYAAGGSGMILKYVDPALRAESGVVTPLDKQLTTWGSQKCCSP